MAALLQLQESEPGQGLYWLDVSRNDDSIPRSDFSPVYFDVGYGNGVVSSTLHESLPGAKLRAPFITGPSNYPSGIGLDVDILVCDGGNDDSFTKKREVSLCKNVTYIAYHSWANISRGCFINNPEQYQLAESNSYNYPSTRSVDFAFINSGDNASIVWVNGTKLWSVGRYEGDVVPHISFPFTRLASIDVPGKSSYLYHQINETTLAEEQYDYSLHEWLTTYITVPNS